MRAAYTARNELGGTGGQREFEKVLAWQARMRERSGMAETSSDKRKAEQKVRRVSVVHGKDKFSAQAKGLLHRK